MRTTLNIDEELLKEAARVSGIAEMSAIVHAGLKALISCESAGRLASLGGSESKIRKIHQRRRQPRKAGAHAI
jgi:Arc/MetJ family transcription regulator